MHRVLQVLIEDFRNKKPSAEYQLIQHRYCEVERLFTDSLSEEQKKKYLELDFTAGELDIQEFNEFALFVFENLRKFF